MKTEQLERIPAESDRKQSEPNPVSSSVQVQPAALCAPDFISDYADWADVFEAPRKAHEWVACQLVASALNGKVFIPWGGATYSLDLWVLLLSGSGQGRSTLTGVAHEVVEEADLDKLIHKAAWGSRQAFFQQMAESPEGMYDWPELSIVQQTLNDPKFGGTKEWITDRYDNPRIPPPLRYRSTGRSNDTPPIVFDKAPRINILATSSTDWFINGLEQADTTGGFIPRFLLVSLGRQERLLPKPLPLDKTALPALGKRLEEISKIKGNADLSAVEPMYDDWYRSAYARFTKQSNPSLSLPFFNRLRGMVLKLAVIFEVSASGSLQVSSASMQRAIEAALDVERTIFEILPTGMSHEGSELEKMAEYIRSGGPDGKSQSQITYAFKYWKRRDREDRLNTLVESGTVECFVKKTTGRPAQIYVHVDYIKESHAASPKG